MARTAAKRSPQTAPSSLLTIPPPFVGAPSSLAPLLDTLDKSKVYIIHIDRHPAGFKKRIFTVPVILNATIFVLLLWRLYAAVPTYLSLFLAITGQRADPAAHTGKTSKLYLLGIVLRRTLMLAIDYCLVTIVWPWPVSFFAERPANPALWRWMIGFRDEEIYVRVSRGWGAQDLLPPAALCGKSSSKAGAESPFFKVRVLPALEPTFMQKTGYLMMGKDWDLDFAAIIQATKLVDSKTIALGELEKKVVVWAGPADGSTGMWAVWEIHTLDKGAEDEGRRKIVEFRDKLAAMGKEDLFFRWVEVIQFESSQPGGFTDERRAQAATKVAELFKQHGVDFDEFASSVGGLQDSTLR